MNNRLQRWGERALGQVQSVSPRVSSRFEPDVEASAFEEQTGFQEIEIETPARRQPLRRVPSKPVETAESAPLQRETIEEIPAPVRVVRDTVSPPAAIEPTPPPPRVSKLAIPRPIVAEPSSLGEEAEREVERAKQPEPRHSESASPARSEPPPSPTVPETSLARLKRFQEWIAAPPHEKPGRREPAASPAPTPVPLSATLRAETRAPVPAQLPPTAKAAPPPAPPAPIVVSIGTIIVRANPAAAPKPATPPPAASLAAFLARRTAGQP